MHPPTQWCLVPRVEETISNIQPPSLFVQCSEGGSWSRFDGMSRSVSMTFDSSPKKPLCPVLRKGKFTSNGMLPRNRTCDFGSVAVKSLCPELSRGKCASAGQNPIAFNSSPENPCVQCSAEALIRLSTRLENAGGLCW